MRGSRPRLSWSTVLIVLVGGCAVGGEWRHGMTGGCHSLAPSLARDRGATANAGPESTTARRKPTAHAVDASIAGRWAGTWSGYGLMEGRRTSTATAEFAHDGRRACGWVILDDVATAEVPIALKLAGSMGVPVVVDVRGATVVARHARGGRLFEATFVVDGDRMEGTVADSEGPARVVLTRELPR
jgi:hypothetical protein